MKIIEGLGHQFLEDFSVLLDEYLKKILFPQAGIVR